MANINPLGAHDTEIPYFSSYYLTNSLSNNSFSSWNYYDQTDYAYSHLSTGWWTFPSAVIAVSASVINFFFKINGKDFLILHFVLTTLIQVVVRVVGLTLILLYFKIKPIPILITTVFIQTIAFYTVTLQYLTGFVYSTIYIVIYFLIKFYQKRNIFNLSKFIIVYSLIIFQSPLFSIAYMGQVIFLLIIIELTRKIRKYGLSNSLYQISQELRSSKFWVLTKKQVYYLIVSYTLLVFNLIFLKQLSNSLSNNYSLVENRSSTFLLSFKWLKQILASHGATNITPIINSSINDTYSGWQYLGATFIFLVIFSSIYLIKIKYVGLLLKLSFFIYLLQVPLVRPSMRFGFSLADFPFWLFSMTIGIIKVLFYALFPFSFLFRSSTMLVWILISLLVIPIAAGINHILNHPFLSKIVLYLTILMFTSLATINFDSALIKIIFIFYLIIFFLVFRLPKRYINKIAITIVIFQLLVDIHFLKASQATVINAGPRSVPMKMASSEFLSGTFIAQYNAPFAPLGLPIMIKSKHYKVMPSSEAPILAKFDDNNLFGVNDLTSYFYQTIFLSDNSRTEYYQNKHKIYNNSPEYRYSPEGEIVPFAQVISNDNLSLRAINISPSNLFENISGVVENKNIFKVNTYDLKIVKNSKTIYTYEVSAPNNMDERSSFVLKNNSLTLFVNGLAYRSIKGFPISNFQFDLNNYKKGKIYFTSEHIMLKTDTVVLEQRVNSISPNLGIVNSIKMGSHGPELNIDLEVPSTIIMAIPFQSGWKINGSEDIAAQNYYGWLSFKMEPGLHNVYLVYKPYFISFSWFPFALLYLNLFLFVFILVNTVKKVRVKK